MNYAAQQWATDLAFEVIDKIKGRKFLVPCGFSGLYDPVFKDYFKKLPSIMKKYDASLYLSSDYRDINFARNNKIPHTYIVPNGAGEDEFTQVYAKDVRNEIGIPKDSFLILLVGSHTGVKGHKEAIEIFKRSNIRASTLLIVGNDLGGGCTKWCKQQASLWRFNLAMRGQKKRLLVKDISRIQTVAAYKSADLFLFPSNIEASPLVLFEAMAAKIPFLTADVGNSAEIIKWSAGGELLPTDKDDAGFSHVRIAESARSLEALYNSQQKRNALAKNGHAAWKKKFTWETIAKEYESIYKGTGK